MRPLGTRQAERLRMLANPFLAQIVGDAVTTSLEGRGLVTVHNRKDETDKHGAFVQISPEGLRVVAEMWETGCIHFPLPEPSSK